MEWTFVNISENFIANNVSVLVVLVVVFKSYPAATSCR
jgi:hypothetical protein